MKTRSVLFASVFALAVAAICAVPALMTGCNSSKSKTNTISIGLVAKSQTNDVFLAAKKGAEDAARDLGPAYGVKVEILWRTPDTENPQQQAQYINELVTGGARGISLSSSNAEQCMEAINRAVEHDVPVMTFDSDVPKSKRFCFYGTDDIECGKQVMRELARVMEKKGTIAILSGNQTAPNLKKRVDGVLAELKNYSNMKTLPAQKDGVFYLPVEDKGAAAAAIQEYQRNNPEIQGWALVGGWPLFVDDALRTFPQPKGTIKVVSVDALPAQLKYLKSGEVQALYAQNCYNWGYESVRILLDKIVKNKAPVSEIINPPLEKVTAENADAFGKQWETWRSKK